MTDDAPTPVGFAALAGSETPLKLERRVETGESSGLVGVGGDSKTKGESLKPFCADDARVAYPLFQAEYGGSTPTSALQLKVKKCNVKLACRLNQKWHSRLPKLDWSNVVRCGWDVCFVAECNNLYYAIAIWTKPVSQSLNGRDWLELRRMAIADDAPANAASRMLRVMKDIIRREMPQVVKLISYQDTSVHAGTIYKAAGWKAGRVSKAGEQNWAKTHPRPCEIQSDAVKVRWEYELRAGGGGAELVAKTVCDNPKSQNDVSPTKPT